MIANKGVSDSTSRRIVLFKHEALQKCESSDQAMTLFFVPNIVYLQNVTEADRPSDGFYIRSGITVILKNSIIPDGTTI